MRQRGSKHVAVVATISTVLTACSAGPASDTGSATGNGLPTPEPATQTAPATPPADDVPPLGPGEETPNWLAPFDDIPRTGSDMFVGLVFPTDDQADLSITGVAPDGGTRWAVKTNPACVGYGMTNVDGTAAAVVLASDADNRAGKVATRTSANAYDARDGSRLWGPSSVPGPMLGPGLIFGRGTPSTVGGGEEGQRVMLAAHSGEPVQPPTPNTAPVYEHHGTGLFGGDGVVTALDTATGSVLWESGTIQAPPAFGNGPRHAEVLSATTASTDDVIALRWTSEDGDTERTALHELGSGRLIADLGAQPDPRTTVDRSTGTVVVSGLDQYRTTLAFDLDSGAELWRAEDGVGSLEITLAHDGIGYGTRAGEAVALDLASGDIEGSGDWPVPVAAASDVLVAPLPPPADAAPADRTAGSGPDYVAYERS